QLRLELRHGPVAGEAAVAQPAEDVPADEPPGERNLGLGQGAEGVGMARTSPVGAVGQFADQLDGPRQGEDPVEPVIADVQGTRTADAGLLFDRENPLAEDGVGRPAIAHSTLLGVKVSQRGFYAHPCSPALAFNRAVDYDWHRPAVDDLETEMRRGIISGIDPSWPRIPGPRVR